ncbi:MAG: TetM/TetW/TetO/TetS family tetracycline resistance ribosomal protection protein, partial [Actinomycetota bacterium]|nr:TetM/TetW/TetO/TetS family tetracycline resistance ribosomal protection protein [Actinomycetota bacterium]
MRTLNLGILAHVDAGKTSLTERLLFAAGVIGEIGSVDDGTTQTDTMALERQRGITIKTAVASFTLDDLTVNLIDTPGHPDFIAEVDRALSVLDGAVLVVSAVEGVQAQTRVLMRALRRLRLPALIFVNKIDRPGAAVEPVLRDIATRLTPAIVPMGTVLAPGTAHASYRPYDAADAGLTARLTDLLAEHDDSLLAAYLDDERSVSWDRLRAGLTAQTGRSLVHPVFFGSAITGAGVPALTAGLREFLPAAGGAAGGPAAGIVFKVGRGPTGGVDRSSAAAKVAYVRMFAGTVRVRDRLPLPGGPRVTAISVFEGGSPVRRDSVAAGQIATLRGLAGVRIGDMFGPARSPGEGHFSPPALETIVVPARRAGQGALHTALTQLAEQDPLINLRQDDVRRELSVSLYGEVQKEVIAATLAAEFGIAVEFRETTTICIERPAGRGAAVDRLGEPGHPFLATVGLRIDPAEAGSGVRFGLDIELGALPLAFLRAVEDTVHATLRQGRHGWQVTDCTVTMTHSGYYPRQSHAHGRFDKAMSSTANDFRGLTPLVVMAALSQAGTCVYEPVQRFR